MTFQAPGSVAFVIVEKVAFGSPPATAVNSNSGKASPIVNIRIVLRLLSGMAPAIPTM
jgi:hypothetical protein